MSVRKLTFGLLAAAALLMGQRDARAQEYMPVADPFRFDPDFRWFEPVYEQDLAGLKPLKRANTGWFGSFDRMHLYFSRPEVDILRESTSTDYEDGFDRGWGNRLELGYMLEQRNGWSATWMNISGPNAFETLFVERINRLNEEALTGPGDDDDGGDGDGGGNTDRFGQFLPSADRNLDQFNERLYELQDSINVLDATSFEINKTWRLQPYHYGGILEPLIGLRYFSVQDYYQEQAYTRIIDEDNDIFDESLLTNSATTNNHMFGGQLGARYFRYANRFRLSAEFRAFALHNWQHHRSVSEEVLTSYDDVGLGAEVLGELVTRNGLSYRDSREFVVGWDARADVSYQLTKMFALRGGMQIIDLGRGLWRGEINDSQDQRLFMIGATFGVELNR